MAETENESGSAFRLPGESGARLVTGHARRRRFRVEVGRDQRKSIMVPIAGRRAGAKKFVGRPIVLLPPTNLSDGLLSSPSRKPVTVAGIPKTTICTTPSPPRPSGSTSTSAKLFVPAGGFAHFSGGDTLCPTQFGLSFRSPALFAVSGRCR